MATAAAFEFVNDTSYRHRHKRSPVYYANHIVSLKHSPIFKAIGTKISVKGLAKKIPPLTPKALFFKPGGKMLKSVGKFLGKFGLKPSVGHNKFWKTKKVAKLVL